MFQFLELNRLLNIPSTKPSQCQRFNTSNDSSSLSKFSRDLATPRAAAIYCYAWTNAAHLSYLALCLTNGTLLFYRLGSGHNDNRPTLRQLPWFKHPSKQISALCFDPSGCWLLVATKDATLYILPALTFVNPSAEMDASFSVLDVTEIKFSGRRAVPTVVCWWKTSDGQPVAIIGNELGEISFVNLHLRREVGGTYITVGISELQLIHDDVNSCTYILITGTNEIQWQLILEQQSTSYCWPLEKQQEMSDAKNNRTKMPGSSSTMRILSCLSITEDQQTSSKEKDTRPKRLVQYAGHTRLKSQCFRGRSYISGKYVPTAVLSVHSADLSITPVFIYKLPPNTSHVLLADRLIFVITCDVHLGPRLLVICTELAVTSIDGSQDFSWDCVLQSFTLNACEAVLGLVDFRSVFPAGVEGCILITDHSIYAVRPRISAEELFLRIVLHEGDFSKADRFGKIMGLDAGSLYERAADRKLAESQVAAAVRLYQVAKCPHIRSVANFAAHGHLSELLSYVRVLFTTRSSDFSAGDLKHFSNMALYCFVQQSLELRVRNSSLRQHFREFLRENHHYDELLVVHLLATYGEYDLLLDLANWRGLWPHVFSEILPSEEEMTAWPDDNKPHLRLPWVDSKTASIFGHNGYSSLISLDNNESFLSCFLARDFAPCIGLHPDLVQRHLSLAKRLIPLWSCLPDQIVKLLNMYNPTQPPFLPILKNLRSNRCRSSDSVESAESDEGFNYTEEDEEISSESNLARQLVEKYLSLLLLLHKLQGPGQKYDASLILPKLQHNQDASSLSDVENGELRLKLRLPRRGVTVGCGYAHAAAVINGRLYTWGRSIHGCLGRGPVRRDWLSAEVVSTVKPPSIRVFAVACGAAHTLAMTDVGVYAWGLDRYGQLGIGGGRRDGRRGNGEIVLKRCHPSCVSALFDVDVVSIVCGQYHSLALSVDGSVYTWGWGVHGQLGHGNSQNLNSPRKIAFFDGRPVSRISAGYGHSLFLTAKGDVYVCGCGTFGQLGNGSTSKVSHPIRVELAEGITLAAAGYFHNVVVSTSSKIYTWGCNPQTLRLRAQASRRARALHQSSSGAEKEGGGPAKPSREELPDNSFYDPSTSPPGIFTPSSIQVDGMNSEVIHVACGANHSLLLTDDGDVYTWGRNLDGQLGQDGRKEKPLPTPVIVINDKKIIQAACGADFTLLLDSSGKFWGFGVDDCGQICGATEKNGSSDSVIPPSPGKILTVRTNKRILQIKSPTRSSIYKPVVLNALPSIRMPAKISVTVDEPSYLRSRYLLPQLDQLENLYVSSAHVHLAIEQLYGFYDNLTLEKCCEASDNMQAAAKIVHLAGQLGPSFSLHTKSLALDQLTTEGRSEMAFQLLDIYTKLATDDVTALKTILKTAIVFWATHSLPLEPLERFFTVHLPKFSLPLSDLILRNSESEIFEDRPLHVNYFTSRLSSRFCLTLMTEILQKIQTGEPHPQLLDTIADMVNIDAVKDGLGESWKCGSTEPVTGNTGPIASGHLFDELKQDLWRNANRKSFIDLSTSELQSLLRAGTKSAAEIPRVAVFTCGHHYLLDALHNTVLPKFEGLLAEMAPISTKNLSEVYRTPGLRPMACPKCLIEGVREETTEVLQ